MALGLNLIEAPLGWVVGSDKEAENNAPALIKLPVYLRGGKEPSGDNKKTG